MKTIEELRSGFEETELFKKFYHKGMGFNVGKACYTSGTSELFIEVIMLQGGFEMFRELKK